MQLGWIIIHVADVRETVAFYERAFALKRRFIDKSGEYAEMETGSTALAFAAHSLVARLGFENSGKSPPHGCEIALVTELDDVEQAYRRAIGAGAEAVKPLETRPWGQTVGYVRDLNGFLVEICTPVAAAG
jgi:lactoylglutathione lyase